MNVIYPFNLFTLRSIFVRTHESTRTNDKKVISIVTNNELLRIDFDLGASVDNTYLMYMLVDTEVATNTGNSTSRILLCNVSN